MVDPAALAAAFGAGVVAGLGVVIPLGAIGVMLLAEGTERGWRRGVPAAAGVASADLMFSTVAVAVGSALAPVISRWGRWPAAVGGVLLIVVAVMMLRKAFLDAQDSEATNSSAGSTGWSRYAVFFGLTAVNPFPLLYFGAIAVGLGDGLHAPPVGAVFVAGVALASFGWNLVLVGAGAALRARSTERIRRVLSIVGGVIVAVCGVVVLVAAFV